MIYSQPDTPNSDDLIFGSELDDTFYGKNGSDIIVGNGGDDIIFGGEGQDIVVFYGDYEDYKIDFIDNTKLLVSDVLSDYFEGDDTISQVEIFRFNDIDYKISEIV